MATTQKAPVEGPAKQPSAGTAPTGRRKRIRRFLSGIGKREAIVVALIGLVVVLFQTGVLPPHHDNPSGRIESPTEGARIAREFTVAGTLKHIPEGNHVWVAVQVGNLLYPKEPEIGPPSEHFSQQVVEGGNPPGGRLSVVLLSVSPEGQAAIEHWLAALRQGKEPSGFVSIEDAQVLDTVANLHLTG